MNLQRIKFGCSVIAVCLLLLPSLAPAASFSGTYNGTASDPYDSRLSDYGSVRMIFNTDNTFSFAFIEDWGLYVDDLSKFLYFPSLTLNGTYTYNTTSRKVVCTGSWNGSLQCINDQKAVLKTVRLSEQKSEGLTLSSNASTLSGLTYGYLGSSYNGNSESLEGPLRLQLTKVTPTPTPTPAPLPDLSIESIWWSPSNPTTNDTVKIGFNARNWGNAESQPCSYIVKLDGIQKLAGTVAAIAADGGSSVQSNLSLGRLVSGAQNIEVFVDSGRTIQEANENNNSLSKPVTVKRAYSKAKTWYLY